MSDEEQVPKIDPDEEADAAVQPDVPFGEQDEEAQADEWAEDAKEGGSA